jgi:threonine dehydratase
MALLLGLDGCPAGWVASVFDTSANRVSSKLLQGVVEVLELTDVAIVAIDIPIGLTDSGPRQCEIETRRLIGDRRSSVFNAPIRPMLEARDYLHANEIGLATDGRKISKQGWGIVPKIKEVDDFLATHTEWRERFFEIHPELAFSEWNGSPMEHYKKTPHGQMEREALIASEFGADFKKSLTALPRTGFALDDFLDSLAALWVAKRLYSGKARSVPENATSDSHGLKMHMSV